ncbi:hypothetical protein EDD27_7783 [Nonomuraea polychroma]|uniref:Uncharacterized protein n=1 Tax=Nonomuraea polychroma TaxID=46176 RepID=A0A438MGW1_9ACTN|nr:hypothetical protein EDD27_7783 [Nonomuraea polychroma]
MEERWRYSFVHDVHARTPGGRHRSGRGRTASSRGIAPSSATRSRTIIGHREGFAEDTVLLANIRVCRTASGSPSKSPLITETSSPPTRRDRMSSVTFSDTAGSLRRRPPGAPAQDRHPGPAGRCRWCCGRGGRFQVAAKVAHRAGGRDRIGARVAVHGAGGCLAGRPARPGSRVAGRRTWSWWSRPARRARARRCSRTGRRRGGGERHGSRPACVSGSHSEVARYGEGTEDFSSVGIQVGVAHGEPPLPVPFEGPGQVRRP